MSRFNLLASSLLLGGALVQAQDASQPWALGTKISIMAVSKEADASTTCPAKLSDAQATPWEFAPVQANLDLGIIVASNPNPDRKLIESFYLTNGVAFGQQSLAEAATRIRVDGQNLCWFRDANDGNVRLGRCGPDFPDQAFTFALPAEGKTTTSFISTTDGGGSSLAVMYEIPAKIDTPIIFGDGSQIPFCIYDTDTGVPLTTPADQAAAYTAQVTYTNLTSTSFKDGAPKSESEAPQCNWAAWGEDGPNGTATNVQESSSSPDCILARTAATMPKECADDPTNGDCILHVAVPFCADLPELRQGLPAAESNAAIETCVRKASLGPCVANPAGAACASGLFAGITFVDGAGGTGSGSASARLKRKLDLTTLLFGDPNNPDSELPFESQFFLGIFKNLFNTAATTLNMLATPFAEELRWKCQEASMWTHLFNNETGVKVRKGCTKMFATWDNSTVPQLELNTPIEQAGSIFADVAMLLSAVGDIAEAAKAVSAVDWVMGKFGLKAAELGKEEGLVLEAVSGENTVQIFRDAGDGSPALIETEAEGEALAREVDESAFRDCMECIEPGLVKSRDQHDSLLRPRAPLKRRLCCAPGLTLKLDVPPPVQGPRPINMRTLGAVTGEDANDVLSSMGTSFSTWYKDGKAVLGADASVDDTSQLLLSTTKTITSKNSEMIGALEKLYGINAQESYALKNWFGAKQASRMLPGLEESMAKMPYATGTAIRSTNLDAETLKMLDEGAAGIISQGEKGVYEVRDLVINKDPMFPDAPAERKILAATMELDDSALTFNARYFFVINSKSGRLTAPFSGEWLREVDFVQGSSGKFRLIGKQELNGGAKAAAEPGAQGPFGVYYFDEVEAPTAPASFTTDQVTQALKDANVRWAGNP